MMATVQKIKSSFRDPDGQVFVEGDRIFRLIRRDAVPHYRHLMDSGLYAALIKEGLLISHQEIANDQHDITTASGDIVIAPECIPFISYPYEWSFSALKEAALTTLKIQKLCLDHGMTLQDATAFNIQFINGRWLMIDTGSFRKQDHFAPWGAYRQFCQHFLAPLLLMTYCDARLLSLFSHYLDGIPLDLAAKLLPLRARMRPAVLMHIVMHAKYTQQDFDVSAVKTQESTVSKASAYGLIDQLQSVIASLVLEKKETFWTDYEQTHTYNTEEFKHKEVFIADAVSRSAPDMIWDMGANTGHFSRLALDCAARKAAVVAFEFDFMTVEAGSRQSQARATDKPLHLWMDLLNPTAPAGWAGEEWQNLEARGPADIVLALALIHHLCLSGNINFEQLSGFFARIARNLVIEFVPKDDPQSQRLLKSRKDIYQGYTQNLFEENFLNAFTILKKEAVSQTGRTLYLMKNHALAK